MKTSIIRKTIYVLLCICIIFTISSAQATNCRHIDDGGYPLYGEIIGEWVSYRIWNDQDTHTVNNNVLYICSGCGGIATWISEWEENHEFSENGVCAPCGYTANGMNMGTKCRHTDNWGYPTYEGDLFREIHRWGVHYWIGRDTHLHVDCLLYICGLCGETAEWSSDWYEDHTFGSDGICTLCGYTADGECLGGSATHVPTVTITPTPTATATPTPTPIVCEHMDEYGNHYVGTRPDGWKKEDYPYTLDEYEQIDATNHNVKRHWNFVCSKCNQEVTLTTTWSEDHTFGNGDKCEACNYYKRHNSLETLTDVDYLAFSALAYEDAHTFKDGDNVTVRQMLASKWDSYWEGTDILISELFAYIQDWEFVVDGGNIVTGFYAMAFHNEYNEVVIAYRGSIPLNLGNILTHPNDVIKDWVLNDIPPILFDNNPIHSQFQNALNFYNGFTYGRKPEDIAVTGHSLGGGLANVISAYSGSKGVAFNGVSILDTNYFYHPFEMSKNFTGIDQWRFIDHINEFDTYAGKWEYEYKNAFVHQSLLGGDSDNLAGYIYRVLEGVHSLNSIVYKHSNQNITLTNGAESKAKYTLRELGDSYGLVEEEPQDKGRALFLGESSDDEYRGHYSAVLQHLLSPEVVAYGGTGADMISTYRSNDTLIGGLGNDILDGGTWGSDTYLYNKGDGIDFIFDTVGQDTIILQGFDKDDDITILPAFESKYTNVTMNQNGHPVFTTSETKEASLYSTILCNGEPIMHIDNNRADNFLNKLILEYNGNKKDITSDIQVKKVTIYKHLEISCPVDIDILDAQGNVVYTVKDSTLGNFYTDYGNFYVFPNEDSQYNRKILDLFEGYSIQIRGIANGSMNVFAQNTDNYALLDAYAANNISVTSNMIASIEEDSNGTLYLAIDTNGDGITDQMIPLTRVHQDENDHDNPMTLIPEKAPTCGANGQRAYHLCSCGKMFLDAAGQNEITNLNSIILPATGNHEYANGLCTVCGHKEPTIPQTGDSTPLAALAVLLVFSAGAIILISRRRRSA